MAWWDSMGYTLWQSNMAMKNASMNVGSNRRNHIFQQTMFDYPRVTGVSMVV